MSNRERALAVIGRYNAFPATGLYSALRQMIRLNGIENVLTDDALHKLALILMWEHRQHNKHAAESRRHHAAKLEKKA